MSRKLDLKGQRFGKLKVIKLTKNKKGVSVWECLCNCGKTTFVVYNKLHTGHTKSCGCLAQEMGVCVRTHNCSNRNKRTFEYWIWASMLKRCKSKTDKSFKNYGGRGIKVCERWHKFENFLEDMGEKPTPKHSIDRIDNNGNYCPENCRWATQKEQARNKRNNYLITFRGKTKCLQQWAEDYNIKWFTVRNRLENNWDIEEALTTPIK